MKMTLKYQAENTLEMILIKLSSRPAEAAVLIGTLAPGAQAVGVPERTLGQEEQSFPHLG
jgi:hypothetical protein